MKPIYFFLAGAFAFTACNSNASTAETSQLSALEQSQNASQNGPKTLNTTEAKKLIETQKDLVILDVRTPAEYAAGHLKNAQLLNKYDADFEAKLKALDRNKTYLVYCAVGGRSGQAAKMMQQLGFKNIYDATEGFKPMQDAGVAVEK